MEGINTEFINKVKANFGLNEYETKVWIALLMKGISNVGEIAEVSGVPRSRVYDVLESLERKGFVIMKLGKPIKYMALNPKEVIERVKLNLINQAKEKIRIFNRIKETEEYKNLEALYNKKLVRVDANDITSLIKGRFNVNYALKSTIKNAKKSVVIVTTSNGLINKLRILKPLMKKIKKSKVNFILAVKGAEKVIKKVSKELGIKIRRISFDSRFCIIDRKEVFIIGDTTEDNKSSFAIHIKSPFFASSLENLIKGYLFNKIY